MLEEAQKMISKEAVVKSAPRCCGAPLCGDCGSGGIGSGGFARRDFITGIGAAAGLAFAGASAAQSGEPARQQPIRTALKVQPALMYATPQRREHTSWREWGAIQTEQDASSEKERIQIG